MFARRNFRLSALKITNTTRNSCSPNILINQISLVCNFGMKVRAERKWCCILRVREDSDLSQHDLRQAHDCAKQSLYGGRLHSWDNRQSITLRNVGCRISRYLHSAVHSQTECSATVHRPLCLCLLTQAHEALGTISLLFNSDGSTSYEQESNCSLQWTRPEVLTDCLDCLECNR